MCWLCISVGSQHGLNPRALEDARQTELIQQAWTDSGKVYGYRKLTDDLRPSRQIALQSPAGQWMQSRMTTDLALQALLSAVWRRKPKQKVMIHSDQGSQFTGKGWQSFLGKHNLFASMSRRGNCHPSHTCKHVLTGNG